MLLNGALFTFLFQGTPFSAWRQVLWLVGLLILARYAVIKNVYKKECFFSFFVYSSFLILVLQTIYTIAIQDYSFQRLFYSWWIYLSGIPFFILPYVIDFERKKIANFEKYLIYLGLFFSIGLIIDANTSIFLFIKFKTIGKEAAELAFEGENRASFLSETVSTFAITLAFSLLLTIKSINSSKNKIHQLFMFSIAVITLIGSWFTGSRQIFLLILLLLGISSAWLYFISKKRFLFVVYFMLSILLLPVLISFMTTNEELADRYSTKSITSDKRYLLWKQGFDDTILSPDLVTLLLGNGIGYASTQKAAFGENSGSHYENSFLHRANETGLIGLTLLLAPLVGILTSISLKRRDYIDLSAILLCASFVFISFVSPNGATQTTSMTMYTAWGLFAYRKHNNINW